MMVVDDDAGMREAFEIMLSRAGYDTIVLSSASSVLLGEAPLPDIYILDKQLSGVDGVDVCRFLKEEAATRHLPVIMISASPILAVQSGLAGADAFLEKPFRRRELLDLLETHLAGVPS